MFIRKKLAQAILGGAVMIGAASASAYNQIENGDFIWGGSNWTTYVYQQEAQATFDLGGQFEDARINITDGGTAAWNVQLLQANLQLEQGKTYRVQFDYTTSSKSADGDIVVAIERNGGDYAQYMPAQHLEANPGNQHFDYTFTMTNTSDWDARIAFNMGNNISHSDFGGPATAIFIDNVVVEEVTGVAPELVKNGNFSEGGANWTTYLHANADASFSITNALGYTFKDGGDEWWHSQAFTAPIYLEAGRTYRLEFDHTSGGKTLTAKGAVVIENGSNYTPYLTRQDFFSNPGSNHEVYDFVMPVTDYNARVTFNLGDNQDEFGNSLQIGTMSIDNVSLKAID